MAGNFTATRTITYATGAIIYAANHNTNELTIYTAHNNAFNASTGHQHTGATGDAPKLTSAGLDLTASYAWTGAHTFSDALTTVEALAVKTPGFYSNIGCTLSAGTFKITGADGNIFSATNVGALALPSTTAGQTVTVALTTDAYSFIDDTGSSDIVGQEFGVTSGVAWGDSRPFFIYAVNSDNTAAGVQFAISPDPTARTTPAGTGIAYHNTPASSQADTNFFFLTSTDVTTTHASKPCVCIGSITMTMSASDDWTVAALNNKTGIGRFVNLHQDFDIPVAQMGAASGKFWKDNGGTAPSFSSSYYNYSLSMDGMVTCSWGFQSGTNGAGAVTARLAAPYLPFASGAGESFFCGAANVANSGGTSDIAVARIQEATTNIEFVIASAVMQYGAFGGVNNNVFGTLTYKAFGGI